MTSHLSGRDQTIVLTGCEVDWFRAKAIAIGLETWAKHKIKVNRAYTPKAMMEAAGGIVGKTYKRNQLQQAHDDLRAWIEQQKAARTA